MKKLISILFITFSLVLSTFAVPNKLKTQDLFILKKDGTSVKVNAEIAVKPEELQYGFMNRKNIPDGTGMLFVFQKEDYLSFWMKNTPTPLSIAYITSDGSITDILDMTPYSLANVNSSVPVQYALEVPQGWYKKNHITVGDVINIFSVN